MKRAFIINFILFLLFPAMRIFAQDTARIYDYAILNFVTRTQGGEYGLFTVQFSDGKLYDLRDALKFPAKIPRKVGYLDDVNDIKEYNSDLIKCFDYLNNQGYELVSFNKDYYIFKRLHRKSAK